MTTSNFIEFAKEKSSLNLSYHQIWRIVERNKFELEDKKIIKKSKEYCINARVQILDKEKMLKVIKEELKKRTHSIRAFMRAKRVKKSYSTVYAYITKNKEKLIEEKTITVLKTNNKSLIIINDFNDFYELINKKKVL